MANNESDNECKGIDTIIREDCVVPADSHNIEYAAPPTRTLKVTSKEEAERVLKKGDYFGFSRNDLVSLDDKLKAAKEKVIKEGKMLILGEADKDTGRGKSKPIVNPETGYLLTRTKHGDVETCVRLGIPEQVPGKGIEMNYHPIASGGQYVVFRGFLDEERMGFDEWSDIYSNFRAFEIMKLVRDNKLDDKYKYFELIKNKKGVLDEKKSYLEVAHKEISDIVVEEIEKLNPRLKELSKEEVLSKYQNVYKKAEENAGVRLRKTLLNKWGRKRIFPTGKCAVKVSKLGSRDDKSIMKELQTLGYYNENAIFMPIAGESVADKTYMVMDLLEPLSLRELKEETTIYDKMNYLKQILMFIRDFWSIKAVHRDIKPQNVMITKEGLVVVTDFGITRMYTSDGDMDSSNTITTKNSIAGSPDFYSPEHVIKDLADTIDCRADGFCAAEAMYTMLVGLSPNQTPPLGNNDNDRSQKALNAGAHPDERYKAVDPINAIDPEDKYNYFRLRWPKKKFFARVWDRITLAKTRKKWEIDKDYSNLCLYLAKLMQFSRLKRYSHSDEKPLEGIDTAISDLEAIMRHEDPPVLKAELAKKVEYSIGPGNKKYKRVTPKTKDKDYRLSVFCNLDPSFERNLNDPKIQRYLRKKRFKDLGIGALGGVAASALGLFCYEYVPKLIELFKHVYNK